MKLLFKYSAIAIFLFTSLQVYAQGMRGNLANYYKERIHFGFTLGVNRSNFIIHPASNFQLFDTLKSVESSTKYGFNLGIVSELTLHDYFTLRFIPSLSFAERNLQYYFAGTDTSTKVKRIESTFINLPIDLKLRSKRLENFGAYVVAGGGYCLDLASRRNSQNSKDLNEQIVKLARDDFFYEVGAGTEFYFEYFKLAIEGKVSRGIKNLLIKDNTIFSNSIDKLNSKVFLISITFEG